MSEQTVRNSTQRWKDLDVRHHLAPFTDYRQMKVEEHGARIITNAKGVYLTDSEDNQILDGMAGLWCVNLGYGRNELAEVAFEQMKELPYYNSFFKTTTPPTVELAEKIASLTPGDLNYVFYGSSGSESNDTIMRMVRFYWNTAGQPEKTHFISRDLAYHGSTLAGASLGGMSYMQEGYGLPLPGVHHVMPPYWYDLGGDMSPEDFALKAARAVEEKILEIGADKVAAFIGEPIMGAGGVIIPADGYWAEIQRICDQYDVLLVADEVICGYGRTGKMFGSETLGIQPDLMTMAKGITSGYQPLSAIAVSEKIGKVLIEKGGDFFHGYTYSGHPVACAVALKNIELIEEGGYLEQIQSTTGPHLAKRLEGLMDHPIVGEVRSVGLIGAVEMVKNKETRERFADYGAVGNICRDHCVANGVMLRAVRDAMVISPPLVISVAEIDEMIDKLTIALDATARDMGMM
ncbi:aspartate aminotransferase family protein [Rhodovibrionaceae bacterium A322]